jgi:hypothetical protein
MKIRRFCKSFIHFENIYFYCRVAPLKTKPLETMKVYRAILLFLPLTAISAICYNSTSKLNILDAIAKKAVAVKAISTGGNSEKCINVEVKNLSAQPLEVSIPAGTLFNTDNQESQDILVTEPSTMIVQVGKSVTMQAYGFCCQASNGVPQTGESFHVEKCKDPNLVALANHIQSKNYDPLLQQHAIWAVSDKHSIGGIYSSNQQHCQDLRKFTADLTHQEVPFYNVDYGYEANTPFVFAPKTLAGEMSYFVPSSGKATLCIYDPSGSPFVLFYENKHMSDGFYSQRFRYTATGMEPGEYRVRLTVDEKLVSEKIITL